jgi:threonine dehydratase
VTVPCAADIAAAAARLPRHLRDTPCLEAPWLSRGERGPVWLKLETQQPTHSFKVRGAMNAVASLSEHGEAPRLVTASAGNHGAALAWAARQRGVPLVVFTPRAAPAAKLARIAGAGADLRAVAADYDEAERLALACARETGARFVSPYNDPLVIAGAGTIGLEIAAQVPTVGEVIVPLGGGGLLSGVALALRAARPVCRLTGAEAAASPAFSKALAAGAITAFEVAPTLADGLAGNLEPGSLTFDIVRTSVDRIVTIGEAALRRAVRQLLEFEHIVAEGAGAIGVAALADEVDRDGVPEPGFGPGIHDTEIRPGRISDSVAGDTVVVVSGANIDLAVLREILG